LSLYVDSSALLKRYVDESDSETAESVLRSDPSLLTARHTIVEVRSNLARLLDKREAAAARSAFLQDLASYRSSSSTRSPARWPLPSPR
jgi:uncharacterized protein